MSWREILGVTHSAEKPYTQNTHNTQKPPKMGNCADIADIAYRRSDSENRVTQEDGAIATPPDPPLDEEQRIRAWLDYIEEDDRDAIAEVLEKCRRDRDARRYFLERAEEVPPCVATVATVAVATPRWVTCGDCAHYRRTDHPHLGHCAAGEPENVAGLWDSDRRVCGRYKE